MADPALPPGFTAAQLPTGPVNTPKDFVPILNDAQVNKEAGVPAYVRAQMSAYKKPEDQLAFLRSIYPQAVPYGNGNFAVFDQQKNQYFLVNPPGLDMGDVASFGRVIPEILGGGLGAFGGSVAGPVGTFGGAVVGSRAGGEGYDYLLRQMAGVPDTRTNEEYAKDVAIDAAIDTATMGAGEIAGPVIRKTFSGRNGQEVAKAADAIGMQNLPAGAVGNKGVQTMEGFLGQTLTAGGSIDNLYRKAFDELDDAVRNIAGEGGQMSQQAVGQMVLDRAVAFQNKFKTRSDELYSEVAKLIPEGRMFDANNTLDLLESLKGAGVDSEALAKELLPSDLVKKIDALYKPNAADIKGLSPEEIAELPKTVSYADLKALRTWVGNKMGDGLVMGTDADKATLKRVYAALSNDMNDAALSLGGDAARAASNAARYYRAGMDAIDNRVTPLVMKNKSTMKDPQAVYGAVSSGGRTAQKTTDAQLRAFVPPNEQALIGGRQMMDMGRTPANPSLSPGRFGSDMNRARAGTGQLPLTVGRLPNAGNVETVAGGLSDAASRTNFSNTGGAIMTNEAVRSAGTYALAGSDPTILVSQILAPKGLELLLENRVFRAILNDTITPIAKQRTQLMALGLNDVVADEIIGWKYSQPTGLMSE